MAQALGNSVHNAAIPRLLEIGALNMEYPNFSAETVAAAFSEKIESLFEYHITSFGFAILEYTIDQMQPLDPHDREKLFKVLTQENTTT